MMSLLAQPLSPRSSSRLVFGAYEPAMPMSVPVPVPMPVPAAGSPTGSSASNTTKDRPFVCEEPGCGRRFNRKFTLSEHKKTHTGEKPYVCPLAECSRRFSTSGNLARHKRLHASLKPFECDINGCKRSFPSQEKLDHHTKIHTGRRTHMCRVTGCTKTFSTAGNLTRHIKNRHPELVRATTAYPSYQYPRAMPSPMHRPEAPRDMHTQPLAMTDVRQDIPSPHMLAKIEPVPPVFSPDSVELSSFQDELSAFQMACEPPEQPFVSRPQDLVPPEGSHPQSLSEIARCSMSVLDEVIEFELTKNV
ncbi:Zinc finger protein [Phytophthora cinnamomi]|uniref:Zinc finger protein n=1 Tax=Phytophthora cinnamomi TaxID=4785 RepID=UPI00355A7C03|nr:Zinc finger protein [Phytophthora cinnamomi]